MGLKHSVKAYYALVKPGIVRGNAIAAIAGYFFATGQPDNLFSPSQFIGMLLGISLIMASGCVFNNYIDRHIDRKMKRTQKRALVTGDIPVRSALIFATLLLILSLIFFIGLTDMLTTYIALFGFFAYVVLYAIGKRTTIHGTLVGAISGAVPPVVGYVAVSNTFDTAALLLFVAMFVWQLPHFYAIAMYRIKDYTAAGIPVLPAVKGMWTTRYAIIISIALFAMTSTLPTWYGYAGYTYGIAIASLSIYWLVSSLRAMARDDISWAKYVFGQSLMVLLAWSALLCLASILP